MKKMIVALPITLFISSELFAASLSACFGFSERASTFSASRAAQVNDLAATEEASTGIRYRPEQAVNARWARLDTDIYRKESPAWCELQYVEGASQSSSGGFLQTPLLLDLGRNGFNLGDRGVGVNFDIPATGKPNFVQWVANNTDDGFLVLDLNNNGIIDDGAELFGEGTTLKLDGQKASNGYIALRQYDLAALGGNEDNLINKKDKIWNSLKIWVDKNADGFSQSDEITSINHHALQQISIKPRSTQNVNVRVDAAGNTIPFWSWVVQDVNKGPKRLKMADVYFRVIK